MTGLDVQITNNSLTDEEALTLEKNIIFFCNTPLGSLPQNRSFGLDFSIFDEPFPVFRMKATVDIVAGVQKQYGVHIDTINITADGNGGAIAKIAI